MKKRAKKGKGDSAYVKDLLIRYGLSLILALNNLWIFYLIFLPLTIYPAAIILSWTYHVWINSPFIYADRNIIEISQSCVAGAAYYLLAILVLSTRNIKASLRIKMFLAAAAMLLSLNIIRIIILAFMYMNGFSGFDVTHKLFWYGLSTAYVFLVWIFTIKLFRIKEIPVYSDFVSLAKQAGR